MKTLTTVSKLFFILVFLFMFQKNSSAVIYIIDNVINAAQEVPTNSSLGTGTVKGTYNGVTKFLSYTITFTGLTGTTSAGHFHSPGLPGVNAGVVIAFGTLPLGVTSGSYSNTATLSAALDTQLLKGYFYANIHTNFRPGGEIRGQVRPFTLDLVSLIEGFYTPSIGRAMVRDTITCNLRSASSPYSLVASNKVYVGTDGAGAYSYPTASNGVNYYLQVLHRNGLETWSASTLAFSSHYMNYDFTNDQSKAYGNNTGLKGSKYCNYSGDVNQDGTIDISDQQAIDNDLYFFVTGYVPTDVNGDDAVDITDAGITENNAVNFISVAKPTSP